VVAVVVVLATACSTGDSTEQDATATVTIQSMSESTITAGAYRGSLMSVDTLAAFASDDVRHEIAVRLADEAEPDGEDVQLQVNDFEDKLQLSLAPEAGPVIEVTATEAEEASAVTLANTAAGLLAGIVREQSGANPDDLRLDAIVTPVE
jgi:hypothetical protein